MSLPSCENHVELSALVSIVAAAVVTAVVPVREVEIVPVLPVVVAVAADLRVVLVVVDCAHTRGDCRKKKGKIKV